MRNASSSQRATKRTSRSRGLGARPSAPPISKSASVARRDARPCRVYSRLLSRRTGHDPDLRHDAARRHPARGHLPLVRGQAPDRAPARRARRRLHRGRLAGLEPEGRRVLRARARPALAARRDRRVRLDVPRGRRARGRREPARAPRLGRAGLHGRREDLDAARHGRAAHDARGEPAHHRAEPRLAPRAGPPRRLRRGALLRRLPRRPGLRARDARGRGARRRRDARAVRHERRVAALADRGDRARGPRRR